MKKMFFSPKLWSEIAGTQWVGPSGAWNQRGKLRGNVKGAAAGAELCGENYGSLRIFPFENHLSRGKWLISRVCTMGGDARVREAGTYAVSTSKLHSMSRHCLASRTMTKSPETESRRMPVVNVLLSFNKKANPLGLDSGRNGSTMTTETFGNCNTAGKHGKKHHKKKTPAAG